MHAHIAGNPYSFHASLYPPSLPSRKYYMLALAMLATCGLVVMSLDYFVFSKDIFPVDMHGWTHLLFIILLYIGFVYLILRIEKKHQQALIGLYRERDLLNHIMETSPGGILVIDREDTIIFANAEIENIFGASREQVVGMSLKEMDWQATNLDGVPVHHQQLPYRRVLDSGLPVYGERMIIATPDGRELTLSINAAPLFDRSNTVEAVVTTVEDITGKIETERQVALLSNALRSVMDAVVITDLDNNILYVNKGFENTYGYSRDELIGQNISIIRTDDFPHELGLSIYSDTIEKGWTGEIRNRRKDGSEFPTLLSTSVVRDESNRAIALIGISRDITERVQAQQALRAQQEFLHNIIESLTNPFYVINADDYTIAMANEASGLVGLPEGITCYEATHGVDRPCHEVGCDCPLIHVRETGEPAVVEHIHYNNEGLEQVLQVHGFPLKDEKGNVVQMIAYDIDLTEVRKSELLSERQRRQLQAVFESNPIPLFVLDADRRVRDFNRAAASLARLDEGDILDHRPGEIMNCIHHLDVPEGCGFGPACDSCVARNIVLDTFRTKVPILRREATFTLWNDSSHQVHMRLHTAYFEGESGPNVLLAMDDITMIKDIENALRESEERYRSLVEAAQEAIITIDEQGEIVSWNPGAEIMFGHQKSEAIGKNISIIIPSRFLRKYRANMSHFARGNGETVVGKTMELTGIHGNGREFPIELSVSRWVKHDESFFTAIVRDITERKRAERELREALARAERADKLKDAFVANISHEIRTPLNIILGYSDILEVEFKDRISSDYPDLFDSIRNASQRLMRTVDMILSISRLEAGDVEIVPTALDLASLLERIVKDMKPMANQKGLELSFTNDCGEVIVNVDEYIMLKVMDNLLDNAIKFTREGFIRVRMHFNTDKDVCIEVKDSGIGMSPEYQRMLFEPYSQEEVGYSRSYEGIGLGLALVKRYLKLHGAAISVSSVKGKGTTFTIQGLKPVSPERNG